MNRPRPPHRASASRTGDRSGFYWTPAWKKLRAQVLRRDGFRCTNCGRPVLGRGNSRVDHIVPRKQAPALAMDPTNLRSLCVACDNARHTRDRHGGQDRSTAPIRSDGFPEGWD